MQLSQLAMEGPRKVRDREQRFGGRGFVRYGHDQGGGDDDEDEDEIESVRGECPVTHGSPPACLQHQRAAVKVHKLP